MRIVVGIAGSRGDVQPVIEIATALHRRGHAVKMFAPKQFEETITGRGIDAGYFNTDSQQLMGSLDQGFKSAHNILKWATAAMVDQFEKLIPATAGADALLTAVNEIGAATVAQYRQIPHFRMGYCPFLPGDQVPPVVPLTVNLPTSANRLMWQGVDLATKFLFGKTLDGKRRELGLPKIGKVTDYSAGTSHNLLAYDPLLSPPARGWKYQYDYVGYPFGGDEGALPPEVEEFLAAGPAPVYLGFGSVIVPNPDEITGMILAAVRRAGCRAIVGQGWTGLGKNVTSLPKEVMLLGPSPHRTLFPRMAGIVHHGGSGTTHNAARAGVPQAVIPQILDQYYWGKRVFELGIGPAPVPLTRLTEAKLTRMLAGVLEPTCARQAKTVGGLIREDGAQVAAGIIEAALSGRKADQAESRSPISLHRVRASPEGTASGNAG
ncbi:MAG TPA: glycosyltransferase [Myxococcales bacterium]|jgi:vancomycin aglycone glucosyltransferase